MGIPGIVGLEDALNMRFVHKLALQECKYNLFFESRAEVDGGVTVSGEGPRQAGS